MRLRENRDFENEKENVSEEIRHVFACDPATARAIYEASLLNGNLDSIKRKCKEHRKENHHA